MELRQLEYFLAVNKFNSFTRAAETLHVSQPTITSAVQSLEAELGIQLFDRSPKKVVLTDAGAVFLKHVEEVMGNISKTISEMNELKNLSRGVIRLYIDPLLATYFSPLYGGFKQAYPALSFEVIEDPARDFASVAKNNEADLGLVILDGSSSALQEAAILHDCLTVCTAKRHALQARRKIATAELADIPLVVMKSTCRLGGIIQRHFQAADVSPAIAFASEHVELLKHMVACNVGAGILPKGIVREDNRLSPIPLVPEVAIAVGLVWKPDRVLPEPARIFVDYARSFDFTKKRS